MKVEQSQAMEFEFKPLECRYFLKEHGNQLEYSVQNYLFGMKRRITSFTIGSSIDFQVQALFFLTLLIQSIILQSDNIVSVQLPPGEFIMHETWDPPISVQTMTNQANLIIDVQFNLNGIPVEHFTIDQQLIKGQKYVLTNEQDYNMSNEYKSYIFSCLIDVINQFCTLVIYGNIKYYVRTFISLLNCGNNQIQTFQLMIKFYFLYIYLYKQQYIYMQIIEPTANMAELLYSLQKFYLEHDQLRVYFGDSIIKQNEVYIINYCTLLEKSQFLNLIIALFYQQSDMPPQDILYIDNQHNFNIPQQVYVAKCFSIEDFVVQLNSAKYFMKKNMKCRLIIIDSVIHLQNKYKLHEYKRKSYRTIGEKIINYQNEICVVIDELIEQIKIEFNAIVIVLSQQTQMINQQIKLINHQIHCPKRIIDTITGHLSTFLLSANFVDQDLFQLMYAKNADNQINTCISIQEYNGKYIYYIYDNKKIVDKGEFENIQ